MIQLGPLFSSVWKMIWITNASYLPTSVSTQSKQLLSLLTLASPTRIQVQHEAIPFLHSPWTFKKWLKNWKKKNQKSWLVGETMANPRQKDSHPKTQRLKLLEYIPSLPGPIRKVNKKPPRPKVDPNVWLLPMILLLKSSDFVSWISFLA
jgi:hypothetical protein